MTNEVLKRVFNVTEYILNKNTTVRATAEIFGVSKSTIHNDIHNRLPKINYDSFKKISKIMQFNFEEKHIRGGLATKQKYLVLQKQKKNDKQF